MFRRFSGARLPALPATVFVSALGAVVGTCWGTVQVREALTARAPAASTYVTPFDLAEVSLRDFGDLDSQ